MKVKALFRWLLVAFFVTAGLNHFREPSIYVGMIPRWLPYPYFLNAVAGTSEVLGGIGVVFPKFRLAAGWGLIALLVAVFPANFHVALLGQMPGYNFSPVTLWLRLPFQAVLIAWVAWVAVNEEH
jgi:uncharacterized membrane protein